MSTQQPKDRLLAGAMSGTSADGVDVAIVAISGRGLEMSARLLHHHHLPYDPCLRQRIFSARSSGSIALSDLAKLGREISQAYARAVNQALAASRLSPTDLAAVAAHGQTLFHAPPDTIQWLDPALIAASVGCPVISDFRRADCAAGGQGAPLVPFADYILFRHPEKNRVMLNIGGIANITWLKAGGSIDDVIAFDTGPGNCVSDWICQSDRSLGQQYDQGGGRALRGTVITAVTSRLNATERYRGWPMSTDGPEMIAEFKRALLATNSMGAPTDDLLATAAYVTAQRISESLRRLPGPVEEVLASGGGIQNKAIMGWINGSRPDGSVLKPHEQPQAKEAIAFALLGAATLDGEPSNVPSATGAKGRVVLGSITPKP